MALSQITGYRFSDWMKICGFDLQLILALQLRLQSERTSILISGDATARYYVISSSNEKLEKSSGHIFAKVGTRDAVLYPRLVPGSIVRVDCTCCPPVHQKGTVDPRIWLVEHASGLTCCRIKRIDAEHIVLLPNCPPLSPWPLRLSRDARILGMVDLELRTRRVAPNRPMGSRNVRETFPPMLPVWSGALGISRLLRGSRSRAGLTLRAAHQMTMRIASLLENPEYGIALGLLSDYEAMNKLPRHVAKIISLSAVYSINPLDLLQASGIQINDSEKRPLFLNEHANASARSRDSITRTNSELFCLDNQFDLCIPPLEPRSNSHTAGA